MKDEDELRIRKVYADNSKIPLIGEKIPFNLSYEEFEEIKRSIFEEKILPLINERELRNYYNKFFTKTYLVKDIENPVSKHISNYFLESKVIVYAEEI